MHILVIEDNEAHRERAMSELTTAGYEVTAFTNAEEAMNAISASPHEIDMVLTDVDLPELKTSTYPIKPYGFALALLALKRGVQKIGILSEGSWVMKMEGAVVPGRIWAFCKKNWVEAVKTMLRQ